MNKKKYYIFKLNMTILNIFSFILLSLVIFLTIIINKEFFYVAVIYTFSPNRLLLTFILVFIYLALHEILHSLAYYIYGAKYKNIVYGIELEKGIFYCLCKQNITKKNILNSLMYPLFYIGILTYIISIIIKSKYLLILSIFNISGCIGDILTFIFILKLNNNIEFSEFDNTTSFAIYSDKDISKIKSLGIKYITKEDKLKRKDYTKIKITSISYYIIILLIILSIFINNRV